MALAVRHPFSSIFDDVGSLFDSGQLRLINNGDGNARLMPAVDIEADNEEIRIKADLPGMDKKNIDVQVDGNRLTISAVRNLENEIKEDSYVRRECSYGQYNRSFTLPDTANADELSATYKDGVLVVTIPKTPEAKPKQIKVQ